MKRKEAFYIVWNPQGSLPPRATHDTFEKAAAEAQRLALANPGNDFFVMQSHRRVRTVRPVEIEDYHTDLDIPF